MNVFDLTVKLGIDTSEYEKKIKDVKKDAEDTAKEEEKLGKATDKAGDEAKSSGSKFAEFGDKLKGVASKAAELTGTLIKVGSVAVTAASAAVVKITKDAVESYGQYEQLVGGAQKIFDEMDYSKIATDAANAYKELNMSASEYIESINLAGATFASTMGDEKGYDTARKGMLAIADYASGTGKNINELNEKFQMITRAASSYQSIADQFSGILPQTSADFLSQAQAAGFLSDEYKKLTDVPVAEYQQAVTAMLEKGVQDLGLSQNTMRESTETLTGSLAMTKKSWENLITGLADPNADLGTLIGNFMESAAATVKNTMPVIEQALKGISSLIEELAPKIADSLPGLIEEVLPGILSAGLQIVEALGKALLENGPKLLEAGLQLLEDLLSTLTNVGNDPKTSQKISEFVEGIKKALTDHLPKIIRMALDLLLEITKGVISALPELVDGLLSFLDENLEDIVNSLTELIPMLIQALLDIVLKMAEWLVDNMDLVIDSIIQIVDAIVTVLTNPDTISKLVQAAVQIIGALTYELLAHLPEILAIGVEIVVNLFTGIWDALTTLTDPIAQWLSDKLIAFTTWIDDVINKIKGWGSDFIDSLTESLTGHNPIADWLSDVMIDVEEWIDNAINKIKTFATDFWTSLKDSLSGNNPIADWLSDVMIEVGEKISQWWEDVKQWGRDLVENFVEGVKDMGWALEETFSDYAQGIKDFIGFSEPKKGPLSNFHSFSPDMIDLFIKGIQDNEYKVQDQLSSTFGMSYYDGSSTGEFTTSDNGNVIIMLENILAAIQGGKVIAVDGNKLVGATVNSYDRKLGENIQLNTRGLAIDV